MDIRRILRTVGLWMLIIFDALFIILCFWKGVTVWGLTAVGITVWIGGLEIWGVTVGWKQKDGTHLKKTISQMFWIWAENNKIWAILAVTCFALSMAGLCIHLGAF